MHYVCRWDSSLCTDEPRDLWASDRYAFDSIDSNRTQGLHVFDASTILMPFHTKDPSALCTSPLSPCFSHFHLFNAQDDPEGMLATYDYRLAADG